MAEDDTSEGQDLAAGDFSSWMIDMQAAIRGERGSDVPCGGCTACCTSSQFVHIGPQETDTLAHIPAELLFPAPGLPSGHVVLGYDERGHCPMLIDNQCSIYEHRPSTCRTYDCRIFPAAGVGIDDDDKVLIARQARRWRFSFPTQANRIQHDAVRAAATFLDEQPSLLQDCVIPINKTQLAVVAIEVHDTFLRRDGETGQTAVVDPDPNEVRVTFTRRKAELAAAPHDARSSLVEAVVAAQEDGDLPSGDPERLTAMLLALAHGASDLALSGHLAKKGKGHADPK